MFSQTMADVWSICLVFVPLGSNWDQTNRSGRVFPTCFSQMGWCEDRVPKMSKSFVRVFLMKWLIYVGDIPYVQTHTHTYG